MRSHLNLEHKTFLGGKLPSCVSTRSAAQGIRSDRCQYFLCNTDSSNGNGTELSLGLSSVPLSLLNLCPDQHVEFYRAYVFKCFSVHQDLWGICSLCWGTSELRGRFPAAPRQHLGVHGGCFPVSFLFSSPANPLVLPLGSQLCQGEVGVWGALGFFWASTAVMV